MERLLEKSLDEQFALERERLAAEAKLNRRLRWVMLPLGIAFAVAAYYLDISTRIALPVIAGLQEGLPPEAPRPEYDVFRLDLDAFARLAPAAVIAGALALWLAVFAGTYYRRSFIAPMYALIGLIYAVVFTALLSVLVPLNVLILNKSGYPVTDLEIPFSDRITSFGPEAAVFPLSYLVTGLERGFWAAAAVIIVGVVVIRLSGGLSKMSGTVRSTVLALAISVIFLVVLFTGPLGLHQFLFDRFVQVPLMRELPPILGGPI